MKIHVVVEGEGLSRIAEQYGFLPDTIWDHPANAALRQQRHDGNVLAPGDQLQIPDRTPKQLTVETGRRHRFRKRGVPAVLRLRLQRNGQPRRGARAVLELEGQELEAIADGDGLVEFHVPPGASRGMLRVGDDPPVRVRVGTLGTFDSTIGVQRRLKNLGLYAGACDGREDEAMRVAICELQRRGGLDPTGQLDDATRAVLRDLHEGRGKASD